jgi:hypothetical protein
MYSGAEVARIRRTTPDLDPMAVWWEEFQSPQQNQSVWKPSAVGQMLRMIHTQFDRLALGPQTVQQYRPAAYTAGGIPA